MKSYWWCLDPTCDASGSYEEPDTKTDTSPAAKHTKAGPCATVTTTSAEFAARIAGAA